MVVHLTIADLIVSFVVMPLEIGWRISVQWFAGNAACKILMFARAFAFYLSSMTLVCLSLDRYLAIAQPLASLKMNRTRRRGRVMILLAWIAATLFALPQTLVFRVLKHPKIEFLQCTSMNFFSEVLERHYGNNGVSNNNNGNGTSNETEQSPLTFLGMDAADLEKAYSCVFLVAVYMVPLFVIVVTYANILLKIIRKRRESNGASSSANSSKLHLHNTSSNNTSNGGSVGGSSAGSLMCRNRSMRFARSQTVALRMSTTHVLAFVGCWTPYLVISAWHIIDPRSVENVAAEVQDALFLTAVFNSCINPLVYGGFYFRALRKSRGARQQLNEQQLAQTQHQAKLLARTNSHSFGAAAAVAVASHNSFSGGSYSNAASPKVGGAVRSGGVVVRMERRMLSTGDLRKPRCASDDGSRLVCSRR